MQCTHGAHCHEINPWETSQCRLHGCFCMPHNRSSICRSQRCVADQQRVHLPRQQLDNHHGAIRVHATGPSCGNRTACALSPYAGIILFSHLDMASQELFKLECYVQPILKYSSIDTRVVSVAERIFRCPFPLCNVPCSILHQPCEMRECWWIQRPNSERACPDTLLKSDLCMGDERFQK